MMEAGNGNGEATLHYFVDEAGDPVLFDRRGRLLVGSEGCSGYFMLGKLDIADPEGLSRELDVLREHLLRDPYLKKVPSMQPQHGKTSLAFHAKDDVPEVRREVFKLLAGMDVRFYAVVRDKAALAARECQDRERNPAYRYKGNALYDTLVSELFRKFRYAADRIRICFAKRGASDRTKALRVALNKANREFERSYGFPNRAEIEITSSTPHDTGGLQAVDYYLWALQRFYERGEDRYLEFIWPQVGEVHDLDAVENGYRGVIYKKDRRLPPRT